MRECKKGPGLGQDMVYEDTEIKREFDLGQIFSVIHESILLCISPVSLP